jgi:hypothetical protein
MANAPFPIAAHRTGRAQLRHPALRLASPKDPRGVQQPRGVCTVNNSPSSLDTAISDGSGLRRYCQAHRQSPSPPHLRKHTRSQGPCSAGIARPRRSYDPVRLPPWPSPGATLRPLPRTGRTSPDYPNHRSDVPCPLPRRIERVRVSIASPLMQPSPNGRRVGIRIVTFEACSGFTHVTAHRIAQPPKATFVTRLRPFRSPGRAARQLPSGRTAIS